MTMQKDPELYALLITLHTKSDDTNRKIDHMNTKVDHSNTELLKMSERVRHLEEYVITTKTRNMARVKFFGHLKKIAAAFFFLFMITLWFLQDMTKEQLKQLTVLIHKLAGLIF